MKKMTNDEMSKVNAGLYRCSLCGKYILTFMGCGVHAIAKHGKESKTKYIYKVW